MFCSEDTFSKAKQDKKMRLQSLKLVNFGFVFFTEQFNCKENMFFSKH